MVLVLCSSHIGIWFCFRSHNMTKKAAPVTPRRSRRQLGIPPTVEKIPTDKETANEKGVANKEAEQEGEEETLHQYSEANEDAMEEDDGHAYSEGNEDDMEKENEDAEADDNADDVSQPRQQENTLPSSGEAQTEETITRTKKTRGPTKMRGVAKHHEDKVDVEFTSLGEHVGKGSITLSSFLGPLVREHVSVLLDDWRHLDDKTTYILWEEIQVLYVFYI